MLSIKFVIVMNDIAVFIYCQQTRTNEFYMYTSCFVTAGLPGVYIQYIYIYVCIVIQVINLL